MSNDIRFFISPEDGREWFEQMALGGHKIGHADDSVKSAYPENYAQFKASLNMPNGKLAEPPVVEPEPELEPLAAIAALEPEPIDLETMDELL